MSKNIPKMQKFKIFREKSKNPKFSGKSKKLELPPSYFYFKCFKAILIVLNVIFIFVNIYFYFAPGDRFTGSAGLTFITVYLIFSILQYWCYLKAYQYLKDLQAHNQKQQLAAKPKKLSYGSQTVHM